MGRVKIPDYEYQERIANAAKLAGEMGLDVLVVNGSEADYANTRYLSGYWPLFERCGVAVSPNGKAALMVGPEGPHFAADMGKIDKIFVLRAYRESADPTTPEVQASTFRDVFQWLGVTGEHIKVGVAAWLDTNLVMLDAIRDAYPQAEIIRADSIMKQLRSVKTANEIACIREAARIASIALNEVRDAIRPGMTPLQLVGIAQKCIYDNGAEYEGLPIFIVAQEATKQAVSRSNYHVFQKGDLVQLGLSAKIDGYSPSIGYPLSLGPLTGFKRELVEFGLEVHQWTEKQLKPGVSAAKIAQDFLQIFKDRGYGENYLYGPCHGMGLIEVEAPWMETDSDYLLKPGMCYEIDTFAYGEDFGLRWEKPVTITETGVEAMGIPIGEIYELDR